MDATSEVTQNEATAAPSGPLSRREHRYHVGIEWTGNNGIGTRDYRSYRRDHNVSAKNKATIQASSDPAFRGDASRWNPEEFLVGALSSCHMLSYLHFCAVAGITVLEYSDSAEGIMLESGDGGGDFSKVTLHPLVTVAPGSDLTKAIALHHDAHEKCFIARSVRFPVECEPQILEA